MWKYRYVSELYHYGVKGMKWGVRRAPEQLGHPRKRVAKIGNTSIIRDAVASGKISTKINYAKQFRHTKFGHLPGRSYIDGDCAYAQKLINELSCTGSAILDQNGKWTHRERVKASEIIGTYVAKNGHSYKTRNAIIVYSKTGSHIYPGKGERK